MRSLDELQVVSPGFNSVVQVGKTQTVCWACNKPDADLCIELHANERCLETLSKSTLNMGIYRWQVSPALPSGTTYSILIRDSKDPQLWGRSAPFTVVNQASKETVPPRCPTVNPVSPSNSMALVEQLLSQAEPQSRAKHPSPHAQRSRTPAERMQAQPSPNGLMLERQNDAVPVRPSFFTAGDAWLSQTTTSRPSVPVRQFQARPHAQTSAVSTNGPLINLSAAEVRRCLYQMLNEPDIYVDYVLANGDTVGQFSIKYILMHAQKRERKREEQKQRKKQTS